LVEIVTAYEQTQTGDLMTRRYLVEAENSVDQGVFFTRLKEP
jgi:hypothetical protein